VAVDYIYFLLSCVAGVWQAWCFGYGADNTLTIILGVSLGLPFALTSYAHASIVSKSIDIGQSPDWKRMPILWIGMPLSLVLGALTMLAETAFMRVAGYGTENLPFSSLRFLIGEGVACLAWAMCLVMWFRPQQSPGSRHCFLFVFVTLYAGVLFAHGFFAVLPRYSSKYFLATSIVETALSALIVMFARSRERVAHV
jgi:hypothetical protein